LIETLRFADLFGEASTDELPLDGAEGMEGRGTGK
jgi:hypothetical protein